MGFPRQEYWSELPFPSPTDLPDPGLNPHLQYCRQSPALQADSLLTEPPGMKPHGQRSLVGYSPWVHKSRT